MTATALRTRLVRVADNDQYSVRRGLHELRDRPVVYYPLASLRRPANVVVRIEEGTGSDPAALAVALKTLRRRLSDDGVAAALKRAKVTTMSGRRRYKKAAAARRLRKALARAARRDAREVTRGR